MPCDGPLYPHLRYGGQRLVRVKDSHSQCWFTVCLVTNRFLDLTLTHHLRDNVSAASGIFREWSSWPGQV